MPQEKDFIPPLITQENANKMLIYVSDILTDAIREYAKIREGKGEIFAAAIGEKRGEIQDLLAMSAEARKLAGDHETPATEIIIIEVKRSDITVIPVKPLQPIRGIPKPKIDPLHSAR